EGTISPILLVPYSVNQRLPLDPVAIPRGWLPDARENSVNEPPVVILPILFEAFSVNQRAPSGPVVIDCGPEFEVGMLNSVTVPDVVIRPILLLVFSVNQTLPSGPVVSS